MTSVKELGDYLEEIVADYLQFVEGYNVVGRQYSFQYWNWIRDTFHPGKKRKTRSPADIDVVGIKGDKLLLVSCKTNIFPEKKAAKEIRKEIRKMMEGRKILGLRGYRTEYAMAFAHEDSLDVVEKARPYRVLFLDNIIRRLISKIPDIGTKITPGRYVWLLARMHRFGLITKSGNLADSASKEWMRKKGPNSFDEIRRRAAIKSWTKRRAKPPR